MKRRTFIKGLAAAGTAAKWNFDEVIDRSGTWSIKYGRVKDGQYAMWIADMDFRTDPAVSKALQERLDRDVFGYTSTPEEFFEAIRNWLESRHRWSVPREWIGHAPGVITGINQAYLTFSDPGDKVIVQPPCTHLRATGYACRVPCPAR